MLSLSHACACCQTGVYARHRGCRRLLNFENSNMLFSSFTAAAEDIEDVLDLEFMNEALQQGWSNDDKDNRAD